MKTDEKPAIPPPAFDFYGFVSGFAGLILILVGLGRLMKNTTLVSGLALTVADTITMIASDTGFLMLPCHWLHFWQLH